MKIYIIQDGRVSVCNIKDIHWEWLIPNLVNLNFPDSKIISVGRAGDNVLIDTELARGVKSAEKRVCVTCDRISIIYEFMSLYDEDKIREKIGHKLPDYEIMSISVHDTSIIVVVELKEVTGSPTGTVSILFYGDESASTVSVTDDTIALQLLLANNRSDPQKFFVYEEDGSDLTRLEDTDVITIGSRYVTLPDQHSEKYVYTVK